MSKVEIIPAFKKRPHLKKIGIYARVSTARREQLNSLSNQVSALTRHVFHRNDWLLADIYMDFGSSRTGSGRREFVRLIEDCKSHAIDYVITKSVSRFGRDTVEVIESLRQIRECGVNVYFMEEDIETDARTFDETELSLYAAIYQSENEHRSENIKLGLRFRAETGSSGLYRKPCYGYCKDADGNLKVDPVKAVFVTHIYDLYLEGMSFVKIIDILEEENIKSPQGKDRWSKKAVESVLTNFKYTGNVEILKSTPGVYHYCKWDAHEAIIPLEKFQKVQYEIARRAKRKPGVERFNPVPENQDTFADKLDKLG